MGSLRDLVYSHSPYPIQNLAISAYGLYLRKIRYGRAHDEAVNWLQDAERWSAAQLADYQNERINQMVKAAIADVPYYHSKYAAAAGQWGKIGVANLAAHLPVLDKATVRADASQFVSGAFAAADLMTVFTSGTTGTPLQVTAAKSAVAQNFAFFSQFLLRCGVDPFDWSGTFAGRLIVPNEQPGPPFWRCNYAMRTWLFSSYHISEKNMPHYIAKLQAANPLYIDSYPSSIYSVARYILAHKVSHTLQLRAIVTSSETLRPDERATIEKAFRCKVYDQYGCAEMAVFAYECNAGMYHSHPLYALVEVLDENGAACDPGEEGELVLTGLVNQAMPLIRYRIGDRAIVGRGPCACGSAHPVLQRIVGREDDCIVTPEGNFVGRLDPLFKGLRGICEAQIVQQSLHEVRVLVVPGTDFDAEAAAGLVGGLRERVGEAMQIKVEVVDSIARGRNGKFRSVVSPIWSERKRAGAAN